MKKFSPPPADVFKAFSDQTRIRILRLLSLAKDEMCSCELVDSLLESEYKVSRHIKILKAAGLITAVRDGKWVYHGLVENESYQVLLQRVVIELPDHDGAYKADFKRFKKRMKLRNKGRCVMGAQYITVQNQEAV